MPADAFSKRRDDLIVIEAVVVAIVGLLVLELGVRPVFPIEQIPLVIFFVALLTVFGMLRIDLDVSNRQFDEDLSNVPATFALFVLSPGWYVVVRAINVTIYLINSHRQMPLASKAINIAIHTTNAVFVALLYTKLAPNGPADGWRALVAAIGLSVLDDLNTLVCWVPYSYFKYGYLHKAWLLELVRRSPVSAAEPAVPLLMMVAWTVSPWFVLPLILVTVLALYATKMSYVLSAYRDGFDALSSLSSDATLSSDPQAVVTAVLASVRRVGGVDTVGVVEIAPSGTISWHGDPQDSLCLAFPTGESVRKMAKVGHASVRIGALKLAAVWPLDDDGVFFLVVGMERDDRDFEDTYGLLEQMAHQAATAVSAARQTAELARRAEEDHHRARTDEITQLPNRFATREFLQRRLSDGTVDSPLSLLAASINELQSINDVLGEAFADQERVDFAIALNKLDASFVSNFDRDLFLIAIEGDAGAAYRVATVVANYQRNEVSSRCRDASVGIVVSDAGSELSADTLMKRARWALERSQQSGEVEVFSDASAAEQDRRLIVQMNLSSAIARGRIFPMFQPQVRLSDHALVGVEALARWTDERLGSISPAEFIPVAEQAIQIEALTRSIIDQSAETLNRWRANGVLIDLSVNISGTSLHHPDFVDYLSAAIKKHDRPQSRFAIEITESSLISTSDSTLDVVHDLHESGVKLSIDDFGTGYSSLGYLDELPADVIKLDRSLIKNLATSQDQARIAEGVISICHKLGHVVVGEGIEDAETLRLLTEMGCDIGQGFFIGMPMTEEEFDEWLTKTQLALGPGVFA